MDVVTIAEKIEAKIAQLEQARDEILDRSQEKAQAISQYDKSLAIAMLKLKNGLIAEFETINCIGLPATLIPSVAKGICYKECFDKEANDSGYKALITIIDAIKAELNGLQSINRHLDN